MIGQVARQPGTKRQAEIQDTQLAVLTQQQVFRLDVTMQDVAPMQHAHRADQPGGDLQQIGQWQRAVSFEALRQGRPAVLALHVIEVLAFWQRMQFGEVAPGNPAHEPFFLEQRRSCVCLVLPAGWQRLQQPGLALSILHPIDQRLPRLVQQCIHLPALEQLAGAQLRRQRPMIELGEGVGQHRFGQGFDAQQQGTGVVLTAALVRQIDQRPCRCA